jgi:hypothetical protein
MDLRTTIGWADPPHALLKNSVRAKEAVMPRLVRNCALGRDIQYAAAYPF